MNILPIEISYEAKTLAKAIYLAYSSASTANIGIMIQQLLNSETEKYAKQVHECGAMLQARNKENEELRERIAILEGRITQEDVFP